MLAGDLLVWAHSWARRVVQMFLPFNFLTTAQFLRQHERSELSGAYDNPRQSVLSKLKFNYLCGERAARCLLLLDNFFGRWLH